MNTSMNWNLSARCSRLKEIWNVIESLQSYWHYTSTYGYILVWLIGSYFINTLMNWSIICLLLFTRDLECCYFSSWKTLIYYLYLYLYDRVWLIGSWFMNTHMNWLICFLVFPTYKRPRMLLLNFFRDIDIIHLPMFISWG